MLDLVCSQLVFKPLVTDLMVIHQLFNAILPTNGIVYGFMRPFENCSHNSDVLTTVNNSSILFSIQPSIFLLEESSRGFSFIVQTDMSQWLNRQQASRGIWLVYGGLSTTPCHLKCLSSYSLPASVLKTLQTFQYTLRETCSCFFRSL
jgi:hypothetical protein